MKKKFLSHFNIIGQCKANGLSIWQCPQFLFVIMGIIILITALSSYLIGTRYITEPTFVALIVIGVTAILFVISFIIIQSFEKLAEASRMKSEFINIVSHQLRAPITNIKWITDFLTSEDIEMAVEKEEEYFSHLRENIRRMVELIDELLIVSRIEKGSFPIKKKKASLSKIVKDLVSRSKVFAEAKNIELKFYTPRSLPLAYFDPTMIKLVVENLVDNAIRYTRKKGKVKLWLIQKGRYLHFKIQDTGVGIPKKDHGFIFGKFFRSENALREQTRGSGLGLYIAKTIIEKSNGRIWFKSREGKGTAFYFILPIK